MTRKHFTVLNPELSTLHPEALRLYAAIVKHGASQLAAVIAYGFELPQDPTPEQKAAWVHFVVAELERLFDEAAIKAIRMDCRCDHGMAERKAWLSRLYQELGSVEAMAADTEACAVGLYFENGELYLKFPFCPCPMLEGVKRLETQTWCECTCGYSRDLFEHVLGCEVAVKLLKSVKMGDDICLMKITPQA